MRMGMRMRMRKNIRTMEVPDGDKLKVTGDRRG